MKPDQIPATGKMVVYRLMVVRADGVRQLIASGIPEDQAKVLQQFLAAKILASNLILEPELQSMDASSLPRSPNEPRRQSTAV